MSEKQDKYYVLRDVIEVERYRCKYLIHPWYKSYWDAIFSGWNWENHTITHSSKVEKETEAFHQYIIIMWQTGILDYRKDLKQETKDNHYLHHYEFTPYGLKWLKKTVYKRRKGE